MSQAVPHVDAWQVTFPWSTWLHAFWSRLRSGRARWKYQSRNRWSRCRRSRQTAWCTWRCCSDRHRTSDLPFITEQVIPHLPQSARSLSVLISHPSAGFWLQSAKPGPQRVSHFDALHSATPPTSLHTMPHAPQFFNGGNVDFAAVGSVVVAIDEALGARGCHRGDRVVLAARHSQNQRDQEKASPELGGESGGGGKEHLGRTGGKGARNFHFW